MGHILKLQVVFIERMKALKVLTLESSYLPMVIQPENLAKHILAALTLMP